jgi:putative spermidine/putrescine transport system permease protein
MSVSITLAKGATDTGAVEHARHWRRDANRNTMIGLLLASPMAIFLCFAFVVPLTLFLLRSAENFEIPDALPTTIEALRQWDGQGLPSDAAYRALVADMKAVAPESGAAALAARRLNYELNGYRNLLIKTFNLRDTLSVEGARVDLLALDARWGDSRFWEVLKRNDSRFTSFYFLTAFDLTRDADGAIVKAPADRAVFLQIMGRTLWISVVVTFVCLVLGFPVARLMAAARPATASLMLFFVLLPFWTPLLVRTTSLIILLQKQGLLNDVLLRLGLIAERMEMVFNRTGVYIGMTQFLLPFAILPLYSVMKPVNPAYVRAALSLGATPVRAFYTVYLPQIMPGMFAGGLLVFVMALGYYILPALVGGPADQMISYYVAYYTNELVNWGLASALGTVLLGFTVVFYLLYARLGKGRIEVG